MKKKAWISICCATKKENFEIYENEKDAVKYSSKVCDIVVPCTITYSLPKKLVAKSEK